MKRLIAIIFAALAAIAALNVATFATPDRAVLTAQPVADQRISLCEALLGRMNEGMRHDADNALACPTN